MTLTLVSYPGPACGPEAVAAAARAKAGDAVAHLPRLGVTLVAGEQALEAEIADVLIAAGTVAAVKPSAQPKAKAQAPTLDVHAASTTPAKG